MEHNHEGFGSDDFPDFNWMIFFGPSRESAGVFFATFFHGKF